LESMARWGVPEALERASGMFALAAYDRVQRTLWLARDRAGEKPLYYGWLHGRLLFGSTLGVLEAHPQFDGRVSADAVGALVRGGCIPAPLSIYAQVRKLPPAHLLRCELRQRPAEAQPT